MVNAAIIFAFSSSFIFWSQAQLLPTNNNQGDFNLLRVMQSQKLFDSKLWVLSCLSGMALSTAARQCLLAATLSIHNSTTSSMHSMCWMWDPVGKMNGSIKSPSLLTTPNTMMWTRYFVFRNMNLSSSLIPKHCEIFVLNLPAWMQNSTACRF